MMAAVRTRGEEGMGHRLSKIVTRTGDAGTTGLAEGSREHAPVREVQQRELKQLVAFAVLL
jgi:hypothetical protein